jgi:hypothetical protein
MLSDDVAHAYTSVRKRLILPRKGSSSRGAKEFVYTKHDPSELSSWLTGRADSLNHVVAYFFTQRTLDATTGANKPQSS